MLNKSEVIEQLRELHKEAKALNAKIAAIVNDESYQAVREDLVNTQEVTADSVNLVEFALARAGDLEHAKKLEDEKVEEEKQKDDGENDQSDTEQEVATEDEEEIKDSESFDDEIDSESDGVADKEEEGGKDEGVEEEKAQEGR